MLAHVAAKIAESVEVNIWGGAGDANNFQGLVPRLLAEANSQKVVSALTAWSATTIIAELGSIVDALLPEVYGKDDLHLYLPTAAFKAYVRALGGFAANTGANGVDGRGTMWYANGGAGLSFDGIPVAMCPGMPATNAVLAEKSNLFFGTSTLADIQQTVKLLDMSDLDGSQNARVIVRFFAGTQVGVPKDAVVYSLA